MGRRNRGPYSPETCRKVSDACRFIKSLSVEARRYYLAERKARWLTNCIVEHRDRKVFALAGVDPLTGRRSRSTSKCPLDATLLDFLLLVSVQDAPMIMRLTRPKTAAHLMHARPKRVVTVEAKRLSPASPRMRHSRLRSVTRAEVAAKASARSICLRSAWAELPRTTIAPCGAPITRDERVATNDRQPHFPGIAPTRPTQPCSSSWRRWRWRSPSCITP